MSHCIAIPVPRILACFALLAAVARGADAPAWLKIAENKTGERCGSVLVNTGQRMLLLGTAKGAAFARAFDPATRDWSDFADVGPRIKSFNPYYQAAFNPANSTVYCLSGGTTLYAFDLNQKTWNSLPAAAELEGLSWQAMACDPDHQRLVVIGADKKLDNLGWTRTVIYDIPSQKWTRLDVADQNIVAAHRQLIALEAAVGELVGRMRLAWYRDPAGKGADVELRELVSQCTRLSRTREAEPFRADIGAIHTDLAAGRTLEALQSARQLQRRVQDAAEAQWPAPCSRRNSPLAWDAKNRVFVLFGGDHEDYLMSDTWVLDLETQSWKRMRPSIAPKPRAGHALFTLPKSGGVALYEGYVQTSSMDYGAHPYWPADPVELWRYDPATDRWDVVGKWPLPAKGAKSPPTTAPPPQGYFYGYSAEFFSPPAITADAQDRIVLAAQRIDAWFLPWKDLPDGTWILEFDPAAIGKGAAASAFGGQPNQRQYRTGSFLASYCEVPDAPADTALDRLPENKWVKLPDAPRNPCRGCRQRDWGTATWDSDRDQVLLWGGGHCVRSSSSVAHYSPASGRIVESYDADEPYGANGSGGFDSTLLNRPWTCVHNYHHYAYDPVCKLMVSARGYLYDPGRMDWLRMERMTTPFVFEWGNTIVQSSARGAVAWAKKRGTDSFGLWLFDREKGWIDLRPQGKLFAPYCDANGMVYDAKRDRMLLSGVAGGYEKLSSGQLLAFDFKTRALELIRPENANLGQTHNAREMAYVEHADCVVVGELWGNHEDRAAKLYTRIYDCQRNAWFLLDAGSVPDGHSTGWMYDAKRKLVYVFTYQGQAWAMRLEAKTAELLSAVPR